MLKILTYLGRLRVRKNSGGTDVGERPRFNFIEGANINLNITDDPVDDEIDIEIIGVGGGLDNVVEDATPELGGHLEIHEFYLLLDPGLSADGTFSGWADNGIAGATLVFGDLCYFSVTDSRWEKADASAESTTKPLLGICILAAAGDGSATRMLLWGKIRADARFPSMTAGAPMFVSTTAGDITATCPTGTGEQGRPIGHAKTANELMFNPSGTWIQHT